MAKKRHKPREEGPTIENRRARRDFVIIETLETGIVLRGTEVKSVRDGKASIAEAYVRASDRPLGLTLIGAHFPHYPPAGANQHEPTRDRTLLAHKREMAKLVRETTQKGVTIVPLKMYFRRGRVKLEIGLATGRKKADRREHERKREAEKAMRRAMSRRV